MKAGVGAMGAQAKEGLQPGGCGDEGALQGLWGKRDPDGAWPPALWLRTRAGKSLRSWRLGTAARDWQSPCVQLLSSSCPFC